MPYVEILSRTEAISKEPLHNYIAVANKMELTVNEEITKFILIICNLRPNVFYEYYGMQRNINELFFISEWEF